MTSKININLCFFDFFQTTFRIFENIKMASGSTIMNKPKSEMKQLLEEDFDDVFSSMEALNEATKFDDQNKGHDLENWKKSQSNDKNFFIVSFFNDNENNNLSKNEVSYIFSKFGTVCKIKYVQNGEVFVYYKEKKEAQKAMEIMKCAKKYFPEEKY